MSFHYGLFSVDHPIWLCIENMGYRRSLRTKEYIDKEEVQPEKVEPEPIIIVVEPPQIETHRSRCRKVAIIKNNVKFTFNSLKQAAQFINEHEEKTASSAMLSIALKRGHRAYGWTIEDLSETVDNSTGL